MTDYCVRATAGNAQLRAFAVKSKDMVETARKAHNTSPVVTAALGRLLSAGAMMGMMLKGDKDILTLQVTGDGPIGGLTVTADSKGCVKGYANNPTVLVGANEQGKLDVAKAVGSGFLRVIKDMGLKEPYVGQTALQAGELGEDLTYYFAASEQVASSVGLGVLLDRETNTVKQAGGFILQLMPFAQEEIIAKLEENLTGIDSVTALFEAGNSPEQILELLLKGLDMEITEKRPVEFRCNCDKQRVEKALISIGKKELAELISEGKEIELNCHFCNTNYLFSVEELQALLKKAKH
ncbi:MAG: Hsp33 family molecular chaperone HslO [Lachnospiraceae bacterium]